MLRQRKATRVVLSVAAAAFGLALLMGQGCPMLGAGTPLAVDAGQDQTIVLGSSVQLQGSVSGGTAPYVYSWQPVAGLNNAAALITTFTPSEVGEFTFTLTVNDAAANVASDEVVVTVTSGDGDDSGDDTTDASSEAPDLVVYAGTDRYATVGSAIQLGGAVSGGQEPYSYAWTPVRSLVGSATLAPTFTPAEEGEYDLTLSVVDKSGGTKSDTVSIMATRGTTLSSLTWGVGYSGGGYQLVAEFSGALDRSTAERIRNYRISGTETTPATATLSADLRTVTLVFEDVALSLDSAFDVSVGNGILDAAGDAVPMTRNLTPLANDADDTAPDVEDVVWAVNYSGSYAVEVEFSEALDSTSAENASAYRITDADTEASGFSASVGGDGRTVTVVFYGVALSRAAKIDVGVLTIRDINGNALDAVEDEDVDDNPFDLDTPEIVDGSLQFIGDFREGGYQVVLEYNEAMDEVTAENKAAYTVDGTAASAAELGPDGRSLTLDFATAVAEIDSKLSIAATSVRDINGQYLPLQTALAVAAPEDVNASPNTPTLTWLKGSESTGFQFLARFNEAMDEATVEDTDNWQINGTIIHPSDVSLSDQTAGDEIAGRTVTVTFDSFGSATTRLGRSTLIDVSLDDAILDVDGNVLPEVTLAIQPHAGDTASPTVAAGPTWGNAITGVYSGSTYEISVTFSETMDADSATDPLKYLVAGLNPVSVSMSDDGTIVVLDYGVTGLGIKTSDTLKISSRVRDVNGRSTTSITPMAIAQDAVTDNIRPGVDRVYWGINKGPYRVTIDFDEVLDGDSLGSLAAFSMDGVHPTAASLSVNGKSVILTFGNGVFDATVATLTLTDNVVTDLNGNGYDGSQGTVDLTAGVIPQQLPLVDQEEPTLESAVWAVDGLDYRVIATFSEALDAGDDENSYYQPFPPGVIEGTRYRARSEKAYTVANAILDVHPTSAILHPGGTQVELVLPTIYIDPTTGEPDPLLPVIPLGTFASDAEMSVVIVDDNNFGDTNPEKIHQVDDMHGNTITASATVMPNPADTAAQLLGAPNAKFANGYAMEGYQIIVNFAGEVLDNVTAQTQEFYRITGTSISPLVAELAIVDDIANGIYAGRTVTLTFTTYALSTTDTVDISVGGTIRDMNGNPMPQVLGSDLENGEIAANAADNVPPTVSTAAAGMLAGQVFVIFNETMDKDTVEAVENWALLGAGALGADAVPYSVLLSTTGLQATLQFSVPVAGETLQISVGDSITDINGNAMVAADYGL